MNATALPDEVAKLALSHVGIISQRSAVWDGIVCDLIVKGPTGDHEVTVSPTVDTLFLTRSSDPHPLVKRLNRQPPRTARPGSTGVNIAMPPPNEEKMPALAELAELTHPQTVAELGAALGARPHGANGPARSRQSGD